MTLWKRSEGGNHRTLCHFDTLSDELFKQILHYFNLLNAVKYEENQRSLHLRSAPLQLRYSEILPSLFFPNIEQIYLISSESGDICLNPFECLSLIP